MQKFKEKLKNTPRNASQVSCSVNSELNKEETLSIQSKVLSLNNPDENQSESNRKQNTSVSVYVLNKRGEPLMPCSPRKAKVLLKQGKAKVVKRSPFTIQLTIATGETKQEIVLGVDTGFSNVGVSAITEKKELLSASFKLRTNISDLLKERAMYRRGRRNKLWYREPRIGALDIEAMRYALHCDSIYHAYSPYVFKKLWITCVDQLVNENEVMIYEDKEFKISSIENFAKKLGFSMDNVEIVKSPKIREE